MIKKDLLIGAADNYTWDQVRVWVKSSKESGFDGDVILLLYRYAAGGGLVENCQRHGIDVYEISHDPFGNQINHYNGGRDTQAHQMRFFHIWQLLASEDTYKKYDNVIMTDVRDVWFQNNPQDWIKQNPVEYMIASSEGLKYKNEAWGAHNMINGFGNLVYNIAQEWIIYNVGVVAGKAEQIMGLCLTIYNMTVGRYIPSDQSAYNILVNGPMKMLFRKTDHSDNWACQCGTVLDPEKSSYFPVLEEDQPFIAGNKVFSKTTGTPFMMVHQWDRIPELKTMIEEKYSD